MTPNGRRVPEDSSAVSSPRCSGRSAQAVSGSQSQELSEANLLEALHRIERLGDCGRRHEQAMVAKDQVGAVAQVVQQRFSLAVVEHDPFEVMVGRPGKSHRRLRNRKDTAVERRDCHARGSVRVRDATDVGAAGVDRAVNDETGTGTART